LATINCAADLPVKHDRSDALQHRGSHPTGVDSVFPLGDPVVDMVQVIGIGTHEHQALTLPHSG
jgi:hypothetical protein